MHPNNFAVFFSNQHLAKTVASFVFGYETARVRHGKFGNLVGNAFGFGRFFGFAHACHFGIGVHHAGNGIVTHPVLTSDKIIDHHFPFATCRMSQQRKTCNIPGCKNSGHIRAHFFVGLDAASVQFHVQIFQSKSLCHRTTADT
jgi:hypothetical protein